MIAVYYCGDGYIIKYNGKHVDFMEINNGKFPEYYAYNYYNNRANAGKYAEGVRFKKIVFSKKEFENIGVSTDGFRFYEKMQDENQLYLLRALKNGNNSAVERIFAIESRVLQDDITICM